MTDNSPHPLSLGGELSLRAIAELRAQLQDALARHDAVTIETGSVEGADAGALQLLLAAQKSANAAGKRLTLTAHLGTPMAEALRRFGFVAADGRPLVAEAGTWIVTREAA